MKHTILNARSKQYIFLVFLCVVSIAIWFGGPYIAISKYYFLQPPEKRFGLIASLFLGWYLLKIVFFDSSKNKTDKPTATPEALKKLLTLQGRFQGALQFLK